MALVATVEASVYPRIVLEPPWQTVSSPLSNTMLFTMAFRANWLTAAHQVPLRHITLQQLRESRQTFFRSDIHLVHLAFEKIVDFHTRIVVLLVKTNANALRP